MANNIIKLSCITPNTYREIVKHFKDKNIYFHTYQLKEERAFRVVIKHLHYTTDIHEIKRELSALGHKVRNITNLRHRQTKDPLNIFFIDLEPAYNNKEIYNLTAIQNKIIYVEPPHTNTNIPQCTRCQHYGHTQRYCNKQYACVKCGGKHNTSSCTKSRDTPAKCVLCGGAHPANYKGCQHYHSILHGSNPHRLNQTPQTPTSQHDHHPTPSPTNPPQPQHLQQQRSYASVVSNVPKTADDQNTALQSLLNELKTLFTQLLNQNTMILSMLTTLINKH